MHNPLQNLKKHELNTLYLLMVETPADLSGFLNYPFLRLEYLINHPVYTHHEIKKKRGGKRQIYVPDERLMYVQRKLNYYLQSYYLSIKPQEVHGFVLQPYLEKRSNIFQNAKPHVGKKHILNIDLKDFFTNITAARVKSLFSSSYFKFNEHVAIAMALLVTYEGRLPTGAPTSPVVSNFVCLQLDAALKAFSAKKQLTYTRYADDLTFSSDSYISFDTVLDLINLIKDNGFLVNFKKLRLKSSHSKQTVTGLTVNQRVNVDRKLLKNIRAMIHDFSTNGLEAATRRHFNLQGEIRAKQGQKFINRLSGYINFVGQVRGRYDKVYKNFRLEFERAMKEKVDV